MKYVCVHPHKGEKLMRKKFNHIIKLLFLIFLIYVYVSNHFLLLFVTNKHFSLGEKLESALC